MQVELAHLADPAIGALLTRRGYQLTSFENVLGLALPRAPERITPPGVQVRPSGDDEFESWLDVVADGFAHPDPQGVPSHEEFPREVIARAEHDFAAAGVTRYAALHDGVIAGGASFRVADGLAQPTGAATTPARRRRGIQTALLSARLARMDILCGPVMSWLGWWVIPVGFSGAVKHRKHGMNLQIVASPDGDIVRVSGPLPGAVHNLTVARRAAGQGDPRPATRETENAKAH